MLYSVRGCNTYWVATTGSKEKVSKKTVGHIPKVEWGEGHLTSPDSHSHYLAHCKIPSEFSRSSETTGLVSPVPRRKLFARRLVSLANHFSHPEGDSILGYTFPLVPGSQKRPREPGPMAPSLSQVFTNLRNGTPKYLVLIPIREVSQWWGSKFSNFGS